MPVQLTPDEIHALVYVYILGVVSVFLVGAIASDAVIWKPKRLWEILALAILWPIFLVMYFLKGAWLAFRRVWR